MLPLDINEFGPTNAPKSQPLTLSFQIGEIQGSERGIVTARILSNHMAQIGPESGPNHLLPGASFAIYAKKLSLLIKRKEGFKGR